jgi:hypothetical protein
MRSPSPTRPARLGLETLEARDVPATNFLAFGAAPGGLPLLEVVRPDGTTLARFQAFEDSFRGGVRAAAAELDGNANTLEVIAGAGPGGGSVIKVYQIDLNDPAVTVNTLTAFLAFDPFYRGGVRVAAGNVAGPDARQEIIVAADTTGGPRVRILNLFGSDVSTAFSPIGDFFAMDPAFRGGVRVTAGELDGNPLDGDELVVAAGTTGGPRVQIFRSDGAVLADFFAFRPDFFGGVQVSFENTGAVGRVRIDAGDLDPSQRNDALNAAAIGGFRVTDPFAIGVNNVPIVNNVGGIGVVPTTQTAFDTGATGTALITTSGFTTSNIGGISSTGFTTGVTTGFGGFGTPGFATGGLGGFGTGTTTATSGASLIPDAVIVPVATSNVLTVGTVGTGFGTTTPLGPTGVGVSGTTPSVGFTLFGDPGPLNPFPGLFEIPFTGAAIGPGTFSTTTFGAAGTGTTFI